MMTFNESKVRASICRDSFFEFFKEFWEVTVAEPLRLNWHLEYLCDELQIVAERVFRGEAKLYNLLVNISPGSSKSTIVSQMYPAWVWARFPQARFICASYAHAIALKDSMRTRDIVESQLYQASFPGIQLREDQNTKGFFINTKKGERFSAGVGGAVTGNHAHFIIIDDPLNPEEAFSDADRAAANRWMESTIATRKVDKRVTPMILIQQRLHEGDPSGEMLEKAEQDGGVKHINLPGELTDHVSPPELKEKYVDGLFDPIRLPRAVLDKLKVELGAYGYASQILQHPVPLGGGLFKVDCLKIEEFAPKRFVREVRSWDKAGTEDGGAWSVGIKMGVDDKGDFWFTDLVRGQWGATQRESMIRHTAEMDGVDVEVVVEIEGGSGGKESAEATVRRLAGYRCHTYHPTGDKETRAYPLASQVGGGTVHVLRKPWLRDFVEELRFFPRSKFKDQVDAASGGFNRLAKKKKKVGGMGGRRR